MLKQYYAQSIGDPIKKSSAKISQIEERELAWFRWTETACWPPNSEKFAKLGIPILFEREEEDGRQNPQKMKMKRPSLWILGRMRAFCEDDDDY